MKNPALNRKGCYQVERSWLENKMYLYMDPFPNSKYRAFSLTWPASIQIYWNKRKRLQSTGLVWDANMAAVSLFWDTNMAAVTSCENTL